MSLLLDIHLLSKCDDTHRSIENIPVPIKDIDFGTYARLYRIINEFTNNYTEKTFKCILRENGKYDSTPVTYMCEFIANPNRLSATKTTIDNTTLPLWIRPPEICEIISDLNGIYNGWGLVTKSLVDNIENNIPNILNGVMSIGFFVDYDEYDEDIEETIDRKGYVEFKKSPLSTDEEFRVLVSASSEEVYHIYGRSPEHSFMILLKDWLYNERKDNDTVITVPGYYMNLGNKVDGAFRLTYGKFKSDMLPWKMELHQSSGLVHIDNTECETFQEKCKYLNDHILNLFSCIMLDKIKEQ